MENIYNILNNWNLSKVLERKLIPKGNVNIISLIHTENDSFILKKSDLDNSKNLLSEFEYLEYLKKENFPYAIPQPIKTAQNQWFVEEEQKTYWIYKFIQGDFINDFNSHHISDIGKLLGIYHKSISRSIYKLGRISPIKYPINLI